MEPARRMDPAYAVLILPRTRLRLLGSIARMPTVSLPDVDSQNAIPPFHHDVNQQQVHLPTLRSPQIFIWAAEGSSIRCASPTDLDQISQLSSTTRPASKGVRIACINCRKAAKRCDEDRPCSRCVKMGREESCRNAPTKPKNLALKRSRRGAARALVHPQIAATGSSSITALGGHRFDPIPSMISPAHVTAEDVGYEDTQSPELSAQLPTDAGAWWPDAHSGPSTSHTAIAGQFEDLTLSVEAANGDKGKAVDRPDIQPVSAVSFAHTPQLAGFPTASESNYVPDLQMEPPYYIPPNFASLAANENFESESFQPYPSWNSADGPSESQFPAQWGWGW